MQRRETNQLHSVQKTKISIRCKLFANHFFLQCGAVYYAVQNGSNVWVCRRYPKVWLKWKLLSSTFLWYLDCTKLFNTLDYLHFVPLFIRIELYSIVAVRDGVGLHPVVAVISTLCSDPLQPCSQPQINLNPLIGRAILRNPASPHNAEVPRLQSCAPRPVVLVVQGRCLEHAPGDSAILKSQGNITGIFSLDNRKSSRTGKYRCKYNIVRFALETINVTNISELRKEACWDRSYDEQLSKNRMVS